MPSFNYGVEHAYRTTSDPFSKRDDELEDLKAEIARLREALRTTTEERDDLRRQVSQKDKPDAELYRPDSGEQEPLDEKELASLPGQCTARRISDSRIGRPKKILVIGGGPAGLITLHELLNPFNRPKDESLDDCDVQLFERRAEVGGVWYFEKENEIAKGWHHGAEGLRSREQDRLYSRLFKPSKQSAGDMEMMDLDWWNGDSDADDDEPATNGHPTELPKINSTKSRGNSLFRRDSNSSEVSGDFCWFSAPHSAPRWPSAAYEGLVGNVLPPLLQFSAKTFPKPKGGLFPSMIETHDYMLKMAGPLRSHIKTCREVTSVKPTFHPDRNAPTWVVTSIDWTNEGQGAEIVEEWDCVIAAVGAFDRPYYPTDIPGLAPLLASRSPLIMHAKTYPGPRPFLNQHNKIVVVGNANSANDIAAHLAPLNSSGPLYRCIRHESNFAHLPDSRIRDVAPIDQIKVSLDRATLSLTLKDGTKLDGVTKVIFASGYQYDFPWASVPTIRGPDSTADFDDLKPASFHGAVPNLHNVTFHAAAPTISFIGLSQGSTPMPLAEIQARSVARVYYGLMSLPKSTSAMLESYRSRADELKLQEDDPSRWRMLHQVRGAPERVLTKALLNALEESDKGSSAGLFRWDERREEIAKTMRKTKEQELRRLRDNKVASGGVDGGVGGVLSFGPSLGQRFNPVFERRKSDGKNLKDDEGIVWGRGGAGI